MNEQFINQAFTFPNLETAFQRVSDNGGCRGSDGVTIHQFGKRLDKNLRDLSHSIEKGRYHPFPLLRFPVPKRSGKGHRYLSVPTVRDRVAQTAVFLVTKPVFEAEFEKVSHGYREGRGVQTALYDIKTWRDQGYRFAVDADIDDFFDSVTHDLLLQKLRTLFPDEPELLRLFEKWIRVEVYDGKRIWQPEKGIPQGSVVSPILANLFLDELDELLMSFGLKLVRFADDFLILTKSKQEAEEAIEITDLVLNELQLELNSLKTKIVSFDRGFKFLGAILVYDGIYLPMPRKRAKNPLRKLPPPLTLKTYLELKNK